MLALLVGLLEWVYGLFKPSNERMLGRTEEDLSITQKSLQEKVYEDKVMSLPKRSESAVDSSLLKHATDDNKQ